MPITPLAWWSFEPGPLQTITALLIVLLGIVSFLRMGRGRWFRSTGAGLVKTLVLSVAVQIAGMVGGALVLGIGVLGALAAG